MRNFLMLQTEEKINSSIDSNISAGLGVVVSVLHLSFSPLHHSHPCSSHLTILFPSLPLHMLFFLQRCHPPFLFWPTLICHSLPSSDVTSSRKYPNLSLHNKCGRYPYHMLPEAHAHLHQNTYPTVFEQSNWVSTLKRSCRGGVLPL